MTVNLFCITKEFAIVVADRRLTYASGEIVSDRATKVLNIACKDACLVAAFNGYVGSDENSTPLKWLERDRTLVNLTLVEFVEKVKRILEDRLKGKERTTARLSLTLVGFQNKLPIMYHISNYEHLGGHGQKAAEASQDMHVEKFSNSFLVAQTGYYPSKKINALQKKFKKLYERKVGLKILKKELLKAARDVPFTDKKIKIVGANCHCVVLRPDGSSEGGPKTMGGSTVLEYPSVIGPNGSFSEIMVDTNPGKDGPAWGHPLTRNIVRLKQRRCKNPKCKNPVPDGQNRCGVCGEKQG